MPAPPGVVAEEAGWGRPRSAPGGRRGLGPARARGAAWGLAQQRDPVNYGRFHGVMVSTLDSESSDPSSSLGGTSPFGRRFYSFPSVLLSDPKVWIPGGRTQALSPGSGPPAPAAVGPAQPRPSHWATSSSGSRNQDSGSLKPASFSCTGPTDLAGK